jgi:hypothetical protein
VLERQPLLEGKSMSIIITSTHKPKTQPVTAAQRRDDGPEEGAEARTEPSNGQQPAAKADVQPAAKADVQKADAQPAAKAGAHPAAETRATAARAEAPKEEPPTEAPPRAREPEPAVTVPAERAGG